MTLLARVLEEAHGDVAVAIIEGEIDASNAPEIRTRLRSLLTNRSQALVVDLTPTRYLDSAAINLLFELDGELGQRQQQLHVVVAPTSPIARALTITGLASAVATHPTRDAALEQAR